MSRNTSELRYIIESGYDLGLKDYPIFEENYREGLNNKILEHFKMREIGFETVALFKYMLNRKMNEIMPLYNQRYISEVSRVGIKPTDNVDMTETITRTVTNEGTSITDGTNTINGSTSLTDSNNADNLNIESDTPQSALTDAQIRANNYASKTNRNVVDEDKSTTTTVNNTDNIDNTVTTNNTQTETFSHHTTGSSAGYTFAQNIEQWRHIMLNVDMEICEELEELFYQLW